MILHSSNQQCVEEGQANMAHLRPSFDVFVLHYGLSDGKLAPLR